MEPEGSLPSYKSPPLVSNLSQMNPVHTLTLCFFKIFSEELHNMYVSRNVIKYY
jgi:hypothetical protein